MKILLIGLSRGSAIAVEMLASVVWSDPEYARIERNMTATLGEIPRQMRDYDLCMIDLLGIGYSRCNAEREIALKQIILSRPALIFIPPGSGGGWLTSEMLQDCKLQTAKHCLQVQHPISTTILREAMKELQRKISLKMHDTDLPANKLESKQISTSLADKQVTPHQEIYNFETIADIVSDTTELTRKGLGRWGGPQHKLPSISNQNLSANAIEQGAQIPPVAPFKLTEFNYAYLIAAAPALKDNQYLALTYQCLLYPNPTELRIASHSATVFCPNENWVASNVSKALVSRMISHGMMVKLATVSHITDDNQKQRALALSSDQTDKRKALDAEVWRLVFHVMREKPIFSNVDVRFQLNRFPNFTRIHGMPDVYIQLALLCMRQPQTLKGLQSLFPQQDPQLITLFVACALSSGMANVLTHTSSYPKPTAESLPMFTHKPARNRSFLRSLFDKLF
ncbi:MAG TPA: hypothetical protein PKC80_05730 [Burkholderiaceae bacterium]|nr:hypothetical protein [Burkholderiaceae bacterium]